MDYTEAEDDDICTSFEKLLRAIYTETKVLNCVSQLRSLPPNDKLSGKIFDIERAVREIEKNLEEYDDFLSSEMKTCDLLEKEIIVMAEQQANKIQILRDSVPQSLKDAVASSRTVVVCNKAQPAVVEVMHNGKSFHWLILTMTLSRQKLNTNKKISITI